MFADIRDAFGSELDAGQQSALISWLAFTGTFSSVRGITHAIRAGKGPFKKRRAARSGTADKDGSREAGQVMYSPAPGGQAISVDQS